MWIEIFGIVSAIVMVTAYALEKRAAVYILILALGCVGAAVYAALIGSWPFVALEGVWAAVAFHRWRARIIEEKK